MSIIKTIFFLLLIFTFFSCNKKEEKTGDIPSNGFVWKSELSVNDIPDIPVKGFIGGKEIKISYINFEQWRGSGDNVLNFGDVVPKNNCGYVDAKNNFHLMKKAGEITTGEIIKASFEQNKDGFVAYYDTTSENENKKSTIQWNCVLVITAIDEKSIKGKIAMCFKDDQKSWIAGNFEAIRCYN